MEKRMKLSFWKKPGFGDNDCNPIEALESVATEIKRYRIGIETLSFHEGWFSLGFSTACVLSMGEDLEWAIFSIAAVFFKN